MVPLVIRYYTQLVQKIELLNEDDNVTLADWDRELPPGKTGDGITGDPLVHTSSLEIDLFNEDDSSAQAQIGGK